ncbi:transposase [Actinophytocola glycyrrhizae]|uniref:Transposase n=1 Tax=Actinophytocola glycyrrhizae TaxID=2044873 RepID=A0ABV9RX69_9PSEU
MWQQAHDALRDLVRLNAGRYPLPTAAIIDSQTVRGADTVPTASAGYDAGKKTKGRKRHIATDILGLLLTAVVGDGAAFCVCATTAAVTMTSTVSR